MQKYTIFIFLLLANLSGYTQVTKTINSIKELTDSIERLVDKNNIPGLMLGITTRDSVLYSGGFGYADLKSKRLVSGQTRFRLGSITKSFVAIAIQHLIEQGKLNLNDELKTIAPEVPFKNKWEASDPVRIVNLLENTTGFDDFKLNKMYGIDHKSYDSKEMMLLQSTSMICRWRPAERYAYCNVNYVILGYIIRKLTGKEYDQYLKENILIPLEMNNSSFDRWSKIPNKDVKEYISSASHLKEVPSVTLLPGAAGSLWSSSDDMIKFLQFSLKKGYPILKPESMQIIETPYSSLAAKAGLLSGYAMGNEDFGRLRGHDGQLGTCRSSFRYDRDLGYGFVISSNGNGLANIETLINDYLTKNRRAAIVKTQPLNQREITPYLGYYQAEDPRFDLLAFTDRLMLLKIEIENDTLCFNILGKKRKLLQTAPLTFIQPGAPRPGIVFSINGDGKRVLIINKHYTEKVPALSSISCRVAVITALTFSLLSVFIGFVAIFNFLIKRLSWEKLQILILPMISILFLTWGLASFLKVKTNNYLLYKLGSVNEISIAICLGITLFGILSFFNLYFTIKKINIFDGYLIKYTLLLISFSLVIITLILLKNGWIGLVTWTL